MAKILKIARWQRLLKLAGFNPGSIDGIWGKRTKSATLAFQKTAFRNPKEWDGIVGKKTKRAMALYLAKRLIPRRKKVWQSPIKIPRVSRKISFIVVHYTASADVSRNVINQWHRARGWNEIGYHYVIRRNGKVETGRNLAKTGAHVRGRNTGSIGIVLTGANTLSWYPSKAQLQTAKNLIKALRSVYKISPRKVYFHKELASTSCPGRLRKEQVL